MRKSTKRPDKKSVTQIVAVMAPNISDARLATLRKQVEKALVDPNYVIMTNYEFSVVVTSIR